MIVLVLVVVVIAVANNDILSTSCALDVAWPVSEYHHSRMETWLGLIGAKGERSDATLELSCHAIGSAHLGAIDWPEKYPSSAVSTRRP